METKISAKKGNKVAIKGIVAFFVVISLALSFISITVVVIDPYFHYKYPNTEKYFYNIDNERAQNDGIVRFFKYDGIITGTSISQNFDVNEAGTIFNANFVKVPYPGGQFKEINDNLERAITSNPDLRIVISSLDMNNIIVDANSMGTMGAEEYSFLYDNNIFNDYKYFLNKDVFFDRVVPMILSRNNEDFVPGMTSFNEYSNWSKGGFEYGKHSLIPDGISNYEAGNSTLSSYTKSIIKRNIEKNILETVKANPNIEFYFFIPPYSIVWWNEAMENNILQLEMMAQQYTIELLLGYDNLHLYSYNNDFSLVTDLNNYEDVLHYGEWVNSAILQWMADGNGLLTKDNYQQYLNDCYNFYISFDFTSLMDQIDYEDDSLAATALLGVDFDEQLLNTLDVRNAEVVDDLYLGKAGVKCHGNLGRTTYSNYTYEGYLYNEDFVGLKIDVSDIGSYSSLTFYGRKISGTGMPSVLIYDNSGNIELGYVLKWDEIDNEWNKYTLDISSLTGPAVIIFNGSYLDDSGSEDSEYYFSGINLK